jgi:hypothetical protein
MRPVRKADKPPFCAVFNKSGNTLGHPGTALPFYQLYRRLGRPQGRSGQARKI